MSPGMPEATTPIRPEIVVALDFGLRRIGVANRI